MKTVPVFTCHRLETAEQVQQRLLELGIESHVNDESKLERYWFMSEPLAAIHVEVEEEQYLTARQLVRLLDPNAPMMKDAVQCPSCGSSNVEFPQVTRKFAMPVVQAVLMAMHVLPRQFYCVDCHQMWSKDVMPEQERDLLGWPMNSKLWHPERFEQKSTVEATKSGA